MSGHADLGRQMLKAWYDAASAYPSNLNMPFEDLVALLQEQSQNTFLDNFGDAVYFASQNVGLDTIRSTMRDLAVDSQGLVSTFPDGSVNSDYWFKNITAVSEASLTNLSFVEHQAPKVAADIATTSVKTIGGLAIGGLALYALGAGVAFGLFFWLENRKRAA